MGITIKREADVNWYNIDEKVWGDFYKQPLKTFSLDVKRIYPNFPDYKQVVHLRYIGMVESKFLDPYEFTPESMILPRDNESIILGLYEADKVVGTLTLNTRTKNYPGLAMELEKKVNINHPYFRDAGVFEFTKLVFSPLARKNRSALNLFTVATFIALYLKKPHFWQVSRDIPADIAWRESLGFDYSNGYSFEDPSLNGMPSRCGYFYLPDVVSNEKLVSYAKKFYKEILAYKFEDRYE